MAIREKKTGWIKNEDISYEEIDVALSILLNFALAETDYTARSDKINEIMKNREFEQSVFWDNLDNLVDPFPIDKVISVDNVEDFALAIGPDRKIELKSGNYRFTDIE